MDQEVGKTERGHKSDDSNNDGRKVGRLRQGVAGVTIALAESCNVVVKVFYCFTMKHFSKYFDNITSDDSGTAELLDDTKRKEIIAFLQMGLA